MVRFSLGRYSFCGNKRRRRQLMGRKRKSSPSFLQCRILLGFHPRIMRCMPNKLCLMHGCLNLLSLQSRIFLSLRCLYRMRHRSKCLHSCRCRLSHSLHGRTLFTCCNRMHQHKLEILIRISHLRRYRYWCYMYNR